jgi:hypothetical protein
MKMKLTTNLVPDIIPADIPAALDELNIDYKIRGDEAIGICPSPQHPDTKPSWSCNLDTGKHHCFSCGFGGTFEWLVQTVKGTRKGEAVAWINVHKPKVGQRQVDDRLKPISEADLWEATPPPDWALDQRGISYQSAHDLEILFNLRTQRWIFPLRDPVTDRLIGWQEKGTGEESALVLNKPDGAKKHLTVFGMSYLKMTGTNGPVVVVENPVKTGRFYDAGYRCISPMGAGFTDYQMELLWPYADHIVLALDNDAAGQRRVKKWIDDNPFGRRMTRVFSYGNVKKINGAYVHARGDGRDPGNLSPEDIRQGIIDSTVGSFTYFEGIDWELTWR